MADTPSPGALPEDPVQRLLERGVAFHHAGDLALAGRLYRAALTLEPTRVDALHLQGPIERHGGRPARALDWIGRALLIAPGHAGARHNLNLAAAQAVITASHAYHEQDFALLFDLVDALERNGALEDAALRLNLSRMLYNASFPLDERGEDALALRCVERAWALGGEFDFLPMLRALRLARQDYRWAWDPGLWRRIVAPSGSNWTGEPHSGALVVTSGNGIGDFFQFMRFIPHARQRVGRVIVRLRRGIAALVADCPFLEGVEFQSPEAGAFPPEDGGLPNALYCDVYDLPAAMGFGAEHVPAPMPYIVPPASRIAAWRRVLREDDRPRIGVVWSSWTYEDRRAVGYSFFHDLIGRTGDAVFVGVHSIFTKEELRTYDFADNFRFFGASDLSSTAGLLAALDLVIAPDGGMSHLACALGLETWVLLRRQCDWRWRFPGERCDWYPNARLFRQDVEGNWDGVRAGVEAKLAEWLRDRRPRAAVNPLHDAADMAALSR